MIMAQKKAPKGYHYMPDGKLMKDSAHKKTGKGYGGKKGSKARKSGR